MVVTLNPSLSLVVDNTDKNISSIETQTRSINKKTHVVLDFPCQSDIEEVSLEKTEKILEAIKVTFNAFLIFCPLGTELCLISSN